MQVSLERTLHMLTVLECCEQFWLSCDALSLTGMYATFINHSRTVNPEAMTRLQKEMEDLMEKLNKAFAKVHRE